MTEITKKGRKKRRHIYVSREFDGVADDLLPSHRKFGVWAERVMWQALVEEFGRDAVLQAVENAQDDMDEDDMLLEEKWEQLEIPA